MGVDFQSGLDQMFDALGDDAVYNGAQSIKVLPKRADIIIGMEQSSIQSNAALFEIRVSEVPSPQKGQTILFLTTLYKIQNAKYHDNLRLIWLVDTYPA